MKTITIHEFIGEMAAAFPKMEEPARHQLRQATQMAAFVMASLAQTEDVVISSGEMSPLDAITLAKEMMP